MAFTNNRSTPGRGTLLDITEVAERLGVQVRHVRRLVHERRIPFVKWGHLLRFDAAEIDTWVDAARVPATQDPTLQRRSLRRDRV